MTRNIVRLGTLAVGLGIGAGWAQTAVASADTSSNWWSSVDSLLSGASPASTTPADFQISFNGMDLFSTTGNEATATTIAGQYDLAIAYGDGASATAEGGYGDYALADGSNAIAAAGSTTAGATGNNLDSAVDIGTNSTGSPLGQPLPDGAFAGAGSLDGGISSAGTDSNNTAIDIGDNGLLPEGPYVVGGLSGAFAGDGGLSGQSGAGNGNTAYTDGNTEGIGEGSAAGIGNDNYASLTGSENGAQQFIVAGYGNNNTAIADTSYTVDATRTVSAGYGNGNYAYVDGPANSSAGAGGSVPDAGSEIAANNNIAEVLDPSGTTADSAFAGSSNTAAGGSDLADVLFTHGNALAEGSPLLYDIISLFGTYTGTF